MRGGVTTEGERGGRWTGGVKRSEGKEGKGVRAVRGREGRGEIEL